MADSTFGLGFEGNNANRFQSAILGRAPGSAAFYACTLVHVNESLLVAPTECAYFGNSNNASAGWELGRGADGAASNPPGIPETVTFRVRLGAGGTVEELSYTMDASTIFGRTHLLAVSVIGLVATLYLNGTAVAILTLSAAFTPGNSGLAFGNRSGGGARSGDAIISAAYSDTDAAGFITNQRLLFDRIRSGGNLFASLDALGLTAAYSYESFSQKAPNSGVPTVPFKNYGTFGLAGDLTFFGSTALTHVTDSDPDYTGGSQSAVGPGGGAQLSGGNAPSGSGLNGGTADVTGGTGDGATGSGGDATVSGGTSTLGPGGDASLIAGDGGAGVVDNGGFGGSAAVRGGNATQANQPGGEVTLFGGDASGAGAPALGGNVQLRGGSSTNSDGGTIVLTSGSGLALTDAGAIGASFNGGGLGTPTSTSGGWYLDPTNGRFILRNYTIGGVPTGSLKLHELNTAGEALQSPAQQGLLHFQTQQAAGVATTIGLRASKSGDYGLVARVYNRTFVTADAPGDTLNVTHNLDSTAVQVAVYDPTGVKLFENPANLAGVVAMSSDLLQLTFSAGLIGAGTWRVTVFGY